MEKMEDVVTLPLECIFDKDRGKVFCVYEKPFFKSYPVTIGTDFAAIRGALKGGRSLIRE